MLTKKKELACMSRKIPDTNIYYTSCQNEIDEQNCRDINDPYGGNYASCNDRDTKEAQCQSEIYPF